MEQKYEYAYSFHHFSMLVGGGAKNFALQQGVELCTPDKLITGKHDFVPIGDNCAV